MENENKKVYIVFKHIYEDVFDDYGNEILLITRDYEKALNYFNKIKEQLEAINDVKYFHELTLKWFLEDIDTYNENSCGILMRYED